MALFAVCANAGVVVAEPERLGGKPEGKVQALVGSLLLKNPEAMSSWQRGYSVMDAGQLDAAEVLFLQAAKQEPKAYEPLLALADLELRRSRPQNVPALLQRAQGVAPQSAVVLSTMGRFAAGTNRIADAEHLLKRAIELDPRFATPYLDLGEMYLVAGRAADAVAAFKGAVKANPALPGAAYGLGRAHLAAKDAGAALMAFEQAAKVAPKNPLPLLAIAELRASQGSFDQALTSVDKALVLEPGLQRAQLTRVDVLLAAKRADEAAKDLERYIAASPGTSSGVLLFKLGNLHEAAGKDGEAFASYRRATEADPQMHGAWNNLAWLAARLKRDLPQAQEWAQRALAQAPGSVGYVDTLAAVQEARGDLAGAEESLAKAVKQAPAAPYLRYRLGQILEKRGQVDRALENYKAALSPGLAFDGADEARRRVVALSAGKR